MYSDTLSKFISILKQLSVTHAQQFKQVELDLHRNQVLFYHFHFVEQFSGWALIELAEYERYMRTHAQFTIKATIPHTIR